MECQTRVQYNNARSEFLSSVWTYSDEKHYNVRSFDSHSAHKFFKLVIFSFHITCIRQLENSFLICFCYVNILLIFSYNNIYVSVTL